MSSSDVRDTPAKPTEQLDRQAQGYKLEPVTNWTNRTGVCFTTGHKVCNVWSIRFVVIRSCKPRAKIQSACPNFTHSGRSLHRWVKMQWYCEKTCIFTHALHSLNVLKQYLAKFELFWGLKHKRPGKGFPLVKGVRMRHLLFVLLQTTQMSLAYDDIIVLEAE